MTNLSQKQINNAAESFRIALDVLRRPLPTAVSDWADANFYMSGESSYSEGPWRTRPFQRVPLNMMGNDEIEELDICKSARVGYTKMLMASCAYQIEHKRRNQIIYQPTDADAKSFMKDHVQPMIRDVKPVRSLASWYGKRHPDNSQKEKTFDNRRKLSVLGGKAAKNYREKSVDTVKLDELDAFDEDVEGEGRPDMLALKRNEGSYFKKLICGSTPKLEHNSIIWKRSQSADCFLRCYIPCPHCGHHQHLIFDRMIMREPGNAETTEYQCESCEEFFTNRDAHQVQSDCYYADAEKAIKTADGYEFTDLDDVPVDTPRHVGLHIWSAYSPMKKWSEIMRDFLDRKDDPSELKTWVNQTRGEVWREKGEVPEWRKLYDRTRGGEFESNKLAEYVTLITMGVDVQRSPGRLELEIIGVGAHKRTQSIDYRVITGDTSDTGPKGPWEELRKIISNETWVHPSGIRLPVTRTAIDSGDQTQTVYDFCAEFPSSQVMAIKGRDQLTTIVGAPKPVDVNRGGKTIRRGVMLWNVGTTVLKNSIFSALKLERPTEESGDPLPPGWCDFPEYGEDYFKGLCSEKMQSRRNARGYTVSEWVKIVERNEPLDCRQYARAAAHVEGMDRRSPDDWALMRQELGIDRKAEPDDPDIETVNGVTFRKSQYLD